MKKIITAFKYLLFLAIGVLLLWLAFRNQDFDKIKNSLETAHYSWIVWSVVISFFAFISRAYRWNMLIKPLGYSPSLSNSTYSLMVGYFANFAIPRLGEVTRCAMLGKSEKIPVDKLIGTVIAERAIDLVTLIIILAIVGFTQFELLGSFLHEQLIHPLMLKLSGNFLILFIAGVLCVIFGATFYFLVIKKKINSGKPNLFSKIISLLISVWEGIKTVFVLENKLLFLGHSIFIWTSYLFSTYLCFFAFDATSSLGLGAGLFALAIGGIGMSAPVQGGIGAFHWLVSQGLLLYGIAFDDGLIYATIVHASQTLFIIVFGGFSYMMLVLKMKK